MFPLYKIRSQCCQDFPSPSKFWEEKHQAPAPIASVRNSVPRCFVLLILWFLFLFLAVMTRNRIGNFSSSVQHQYFSVAILLFIVNYIKLTDLWSFQECSSQDSSLELCDMTDSCLDDSRLQSALSCDSTRSRDRSRRSDSRSLDVSDTSSVHSRSPSASITMVRNLS